MGHGDTITIRFNLPPDAAPLGHILHGWEPEFEITGELIPLITATRTAPAEGGGVEITSVTFVPAIAESRPTLNFLSSALKGLMCHLLETDMPLRLSIEELLLEAAGARAEGARRSA